MKRIARVLVATALALTSGCARPDWIQDTVVTVDVTGFEGPIDGTVGGDVFTFRLTNETTVGEMTVSGDEMNGNVTIGTRDQSVAGLHAPI
jgi:hypothetical protein